ncbi:sterol-binding protein [Duganella sp. BJB488]|uniref:ubiquinone biosynthesis accessory factor UbiJ n=1 Tax=unclassified Duganella TaxID=2636909 RepID=UPI000E34982E|nr:MULTISPECIES: SCP2 sterol-binding domain-containing protein [unclassified Duganella]RFP14037.1 sterol-binding protein [Duganella sp. BJB489]RFP17379.1 sterol-binding protein [Duganella sp. BJB488]RFP31831.1 sterol-binding protein [Duganella sp. BJB480]
MTPPNFSAAAPASAAINHLLAQEPWARKELLRHAGKIAAIDTGAVVLRLRVTADGMLEAAPPEEPARVTIRVKLSDLPLIAQNRERAFSYVQIEGDAEFANAISNLSKSLRWEAEHDLEKVVGPIAAVRVVSGARAAFEAIRNGHQKLAENVAEFLLDEKPVLIRPQTVEAFSADVVRLRDDVERAAKRLAKLEQKLDPKK